MICLCKKLLSLFFIGPSQYWKPSLLQAKPSHPVFTGEVLMMLPKMWFAFWALSTHC